MIAPTWLLKSVVLAVHREQLAEHGGRPGLRDEGLLDSALDRPRKRFDYDANADIFDLAASYAYGLARNHPFIDGNKRVSLVIAEAFLAINGHGIVAEDVEVLSNWLRLAEDHLSEAQLAAWFRDSAIDLDR